MKLLLATAMAVAMIGTAHAALNENVLICHPKDETVLATRVFAQPNKASQSEPVQGTGNTLYVTSRANGFFEGVYMSTKNWPATAHAFVLPKQWDCRTNDGWYEQCLKDSKAAGTDDSGCESN